MADTPTADRLESLRIDRTRGTDRRRRGRWLLLLLPLLLLLAGLLVTIRRAPVVEVTQVRQARPGEQATELTASGYVASRRRSILAPKVPGRLDAVLVDEGEAVEEGQVLARLDDADARVGLERALAESRVADARLEAAQVMREKARRDLRRARVLHQGGAIGDAEFQNARTALRSAEANWRATRAGQRAARKGVEAARLTLEHTVIRAPFAGTVARKLADEGAVLAPAAIEQQNVGGIIELVDLDALEVEAEVSEDQLHRIRPGQPAIIFLGAFQDRAFPAVTGTVRPAVDRARATATVKVQFREMPPGVLPDMAARVAFLSEEVPPGELERQRPELRVPSSAVVERDGRPVVLAVEDGRLRAEPVQPRERVGDEIALLQGPPPGTRIVSSPGGRLRPGSRVKVKGG